jgi:hypothetical protein
MVKRISSSWKGKPVLGENAGNLYTPETVELRDAVVVWRIQELAVRRPSRLDGTTPAIAAIARPIIRPSLALASRLSPLR